MNKQIIFKTVILATFYLIANSKMFLLAEYPNDTTTFNQLIEHTTIIADFNGDQIKDTLKSYIRLSDHSFPTSIHWGKSPYDTTTKISIFKYPTWSNIKASLCVDRYDQDSLSDMMFFLWGKIQIDSVNQLDTGRILLIWGQPGLDSLNFINIDSLLFVSSNPISPSINQNGSDMNTYYISNQPKMASNELIRGREIINPVPTANKKSSNFELKIPERKLKKNQIESNVAIIKDKWGVRLFPNPTNGSITLIVETLPVGQYKITVFDNSGVKVIKSDLTINSMGPYSKQFDMSELPSGDYMLVIHLGNQIFGSYKFVIVK
ncbi:MAG: T9SS type A sorting domain-containing protein [Candidatus Kapabacteria bacterium]|nr:T9SS type A sorting domain-containing protein [Candidatus Kapabacteria bacterium]